MPDRPLTPREVADHYGVHPETVIRWATDELLPGFKTPSGRWRFHRADVAAFPAPETEDVA